jgi:hypothetical protein
MPIVMKPRKMIRFKGRRLLIAEREAARWLNDFRSQFPDSIVVDIRFSPAEPQQVQFLADALIAIMLAELLY